MKKLRQVRDARIELANMREGWLANRSSLLAGAHRRASGAMAGNLRVNHERRMVDQTGIEPVTS